MTTPREDKGTLFLCAIFLLVVAGFFVANVGDWLNLDPANFIRR